MRCTQDGRILDGDVDLVVKPIRHPPPDLIGCRPPRVQHHIEGVIDVVCPAFLPQALLKLLTTPGTHSSISRPSQATWTPRRVSSAACSESSSRMGLVLLMWIKTFRVPPGSF